MRRRNAAPRSEEHTSELQSLRHLVCRLLLEKKKNQHPLTNAVNTSRYTSAQRLTLVEREGAQRSGYALQCTQVPTVCRLFTFFFFFNDTATPEIYTLSLHDALPI